VEEAFTRKYRSEKCYTTRGFRTLIYQLLLGQGKTFFYQKNAVEGLLVCPDTLFIDRTVFVSYKNVFQQYGLKKYRMA